MMKFQNSLVANKHVEWFIAGYVKEYVDQMHHGDKVVFNNLYIRAVNVVFSHLRGTKVLDGSCSDLECYIALEAKQVFGLMVPVENIPY